MNVFRARIRDERGATAVEYGALVSLVAAVIVMAVMALGQSTSNNLDCSGQSVATRTNACSSASGAVQSPGSTITPTASPTTNPTSSPTSNPTPGNGNGNGSGNGNGNGGNGNGNGKGH